MEFKIVFQMGFVYMCTQMHTYAYTHAHAVVVHTKYVLTYTWSLERVWVTV